MVNGVAGSVLTKNSSASPPRTLDRDANPSIHGHRHLVFGSTRVYVSCQSSVPSRSFSVWIRSRFGESANAGTAAALAMAASSWRRSISDIGESSINTTMLFTLPQRFAPPQGFSDAVQHLYSDFCEGLGHVMSLN